MSAQPQTQSKLYTSIQQDQKAKLDYHNVVCVYGGRGRVSGGGGGLEVLKCFVRGIQNFFYLLCVCVRGGLGSVPLFREKITDLPPINK